MKNTTICHDHPIDLEMTPGGKPDSSVDAFFNTFWSLQEIFTNPSMISDPLHFEPMQSKFNLVLQKFQEIQNESESAGDRKKQRKERNIGLKTQFFFPKFLTDYNLFQLELSDPSFRRQILMQMLIVCNYVQLCSSQGTSSNVDKFSPTQVTLVGELMDRIWSVMERISPQGKLYAKMAKDVLEDESRWVKWKSQGCPDFSKPQTVFDTRSRLQNLEKSKAVDPEWIGNEELSRLWKKSKESLSSRDSEFTMPTVDSLLYELDGQVEEDGETLANSVDDSNNVLYNDMSYNWRLCRVAVRDNLEYFDTEDDFDSARPGRFLLHKWRAANASTLKVL